MYWQSFINHYMVSEWDLFFRVLVRLSEMNLCKPPDPLCLTGNNAKNWREFKEQLQWFLAGTESSDKSDPVKIGIMLSHAGKDARRCIRYSPGLKMVIIINLIKF